MKKSLPADSPRFSGHLRHYHRGGAQIPRSWDDWVDGTASKPRRMKSWPKVFGLVIAALVLIGIVIGLMIELS